ncbi:MAG: CBS domain-containing protein [Anaerolineae bacterium]
MTTCSDVMTTNPTCCVSTDTVERAAQMMKAEDVGSIPVVESQNTKRLVGIVTDRDLVLKVLAAGPNGHDQAVGDVMTHDPVACRERDDLNKALQAMSDHQVRRIPIVNDQHEVVGIVAQADIATRTEQPHKTAGVVEDISKPNTKVTR